MSNVNVLDITKEQFNQEVIQSDLPVLIDFWTEGCGPCEAMVPALESVASMLAGKVKFVKHEVTMEDVLENQSEIVAAYDVMAFPTLLLFQNGEVVKSFIGAMFEDELLDFLKEVR